MRIHYIQHAPFENLGSLEQALQKKGHSIDCTRMYDDQPNLPDVKGFDWLIVMGGPMGIFDEAQYPWLATEKHFIKAAIDADKTVLGICLGAQLLAHVLGAGVYPNHHREIGWYDLSPSSDVKETALAQVFHSVLPVFNWHGDTFDIPDGAQRIGSTPACANQGFVFEDNVVALQFHLETTYESASALIAHCGNELDGSKWVQSPEQILADRERFERLNQSAISLIEALGA